MGLMLKSKISVFNDFSNGFYIFPFFGGIFGNPKINQKQIPIARAKINRFELK